MGDAIARELTGGTVTRTYVTDESGAIVKVCDPDCTGSNPQYLVTWNGHGDAQALWRINADGTLTLANSYTYTTWGTPTTATHNGIGNLGFRYLYVGRHGVAWDHALSLGLAHMGARHYSPALGRFLQPDPSALEENLYAYGANSPVTKVDPSGEAAECALAPNPALRPGCELGYLGWVAAGAALGFLLGGLASAARTLPTPWARVDTSTWRQPYTSCFVIGEDPVRVERSAPSWRCSTMPRIPLALPRYIKLISNQEWMLLRMLNESVATTWDPSTGWDSV